jgi:hypothetical protein
VAVKLDINIPNFIPQKHFGGTAYFFPPHEKTGDKSVSAWLAGLGPYKIKRA